MIEIQNIERVDKGSLLAKCDVYVKPWHLILREVKVFQKGDRRWVGMPAKEGMGHDGVKIYSELVEFDSDGVKKRFRSLIMDAVDAYIEKNPSMTPEPIFGQQDEMPF